MNSDLTLLVVQRLSYDDLLRFILQNRRTARMLANQNFWSRLYQIHFRPLPYHPTLSPYSAYRTSRLLQNYHEEGAEDLLSVLTGLQLVVSAESRLYWTESEESHLRHRLELYYSVLADEEEALSFALRERPTHQTSRTIRFLFGSTETLLKQIGAGISLRTVQYRILLRRYQFDNSFYLISTRETTQFETELQSQNPTSLVQLQEELLCLIEQGLSPLPERLELPELVRQLRSVSKNRSD